jgi:hypothetical protein
MTRAATGREENHRQQGEQTGGGRHLAERVDRKNASAYVNGFTAQWTLLTMRRIAALILLATPLAGCPRPMPPPSGKPGVGTIRGYVRLGPEEESFQRCGDTTADTMWLGEGRDETWAPVSKILGAQPECDLDTIPCDHQEAYVELDGTISEPGHYGHMEMYNRELRPRRVTYAARTAPTDCPQPAPPTVGKVGVGALRGYLHVGPEEHSLQLCGEAVDKRIWVDTDSHIGEGWGVVKQVLDSWPDCEHGRGPCGHRYLYVELDGTISEPGRYGHMGAYKRELKARRYTHAARFTIADCEQPGWNTRTRP